MGSALGHGLSICQLKVSLYQICVLDQNIVQKIKLYKNESIQISNWPDNGIIAEGAHQNNGQNSGVLIQKNCDKNEKG